MATSTHRLPGADRARHRTFEQLLSQQDAILRGRKQVLRDGLPTAASGVLDAEEHALDEEGQVLAFSVLGITSRTVHGIETALRRLEAGEFGVCSGCLRRIGDARLRALPFATLCLACQHEHDGAAAATAKRS
jgi:DnaK suppressor protein